MGIHCSRKVGFTKVMNVPFCFSVTKYMYSMSKHIETCLLCGWNNISFQLST